MASGYEVSYSAKSPLLDNLQALPKTHLKQSKNTHEMYIEVFIKHNLEGAATIFNK